MLHVTGVTAALPGGDDLLRQLLVEAKRRRIVVTVDLNLRPRLLAGRSARHLLGLVVALSDVVLGTPEEVAAVLGNADHHDLTRRCRRLGLTAIVVHDADAAVYVDGDSATARSSRPSAILDPAGAGEAFAGGVTAGILARLPAAELLDLAHRCARAQLAVLGDNTAAPHVAPVTPLAPTIAPVATVSETNSAKGLG